LKDFNLRSSGEPYSWCKVCLRAHKKEVRDKNLKSSNAKIQELREARREKIREVIFEYLLKHSCITCGEKDPIVLEFDHREPKKKEFCIAKALHEVPRLQRVLDEIAKCDILCANCHKRKTAKQIGNYKLRYMAL